MYARPAVRLRCRRGAAGRAGEAGPPARKGDRESPRIEVQEAGYCPGYPRPKDGRPGIQGYYDSKENAHLYDDVKSSYWKGTLVHEMVHALQDQHFGLRKPHAASFGSDAELALAALVRATPRSP